MTVAPREVVYDCEESELDREVIMKEQDKIWRGRRNPSKASLDVEDMGGMLEENVVTHQRPA